MGRRGSVIVLRYVHSFTDRHGHQRHYFRRHGKRIALPGEPGSAEFMDAYTAALDGESRDPTRRAPIAPRSFGALAASYFASPAYLRLAASSRINYRRVIEAFLAEHGQRRVDQMDRANVNHLVGKMTDRPGAGIVFLKRLKVLLNYAIEIGWISHNPASGAKSYRSSSFHTWTEDEIAQFERRWSIGTKQRLAFALLLYTGQRGSDVHRLAWPDVDGFRVVQKKTGTALVVPVHPALAAILAKAKREHAVVLATEFGRPFTVKGFGQFMSAAIKAAGLPAHCKAHGLRKATARRLAEGDATAKQIAAVTGHKTLSEVEKYTAAANQPKLAQQAFAKQSANAGLANRTNRIGKPEK